MEHDVIAKFVDQRRSRTFGQEPTLGVKPATWNLHAQDPKRAVTWYDEGAACLFWVSFKLAIIGEGRAETNVAFIRVSSDDVAIVYLSYYKKY